MTSNRLSAPDFHNAFHFIHLTPGGQVSPNDKFFQKKFHEKFVSEPVCENWSFLSTIELFI